MVIKQPFLNRFSVGKTGLITTNQKSWWLRLKPIFTGQQDLILRVAQAYFDVIYASENPGLCKANKASISQQLASARKILRLAQQPSPTVTKHKARYDLALAQEIAAESDQS